MGPVCGKRDLAACRAASRDSELGNSRLGNSLFFTFFATLIFRDSNLSRLGNSLRFALHSVRGRLSASTEKFAPSKENLAQARLIGTLSGRLSALRSVFINSNRKISN